MTNSNAMRKMTAQLTWGEVVLRDENKRRIGGLWCADGDGMVTVLVVAPGEEHDFRALVEEMSDYGEGWEALNGPTRPGAYLFEQAELRGLYLPSERNHTVIDDDFVLRALLMGEQLMAAESPDMFEHLGGAPIGAHHDNDFVDTQPNHRQEKPPI